LPSSGNFFNNVINFVFESVANNVDDIIEEVAAARQTERGGRADDKRSETAMEDRKKEGYF
jgi:sulfate adenylyltransferase subunit 2